MNFNLCQFLKQSSQLQMHIHSELIYRFCIDVTLKSYEYSMVYRCAGCTKLLSNY